MRADAIGEPLDLGVGAAHGGGGLAAAQRARQRRVKLGFLGVFVGQDPVGEQAVRAISDSSRRSIGGPAASRSALSRSSAEGVAQFVVFGGEAAQHLFGVRRTTPPRWPGYREGRAAH